MACWPSSDFNPAHEDSARGHRDAAHELKTAFDSESDTDPIGNIRMRQLLLMEDCLKAIGFPTHDEHKARVSLVPCIFQEATDEEFARYVEESFNFIDRGQNKK